MHIGQVSVTSKMHKKWSPVNFPSKLF